MAEDASTRRWRSCGFTAARWWISRRTSAAATTDWRDSYLAQGEQKQQQLDLMLRYAESNQCRMAALVRHFGDLRRCAQALRHLRFLRAGRLRRAALPPGHRAEHSAAARIARSTALPSGARATGKLHSELFPRAELTPQCVRGSAGRAGARGSGAAHEAVFEKDGKDIPYRKASLTAAGNAVDEPGRLELR